MNIVAVGCSCGKCCSKSLPCEKCLKNTLKANGISITEDNINKFKDLKHIAMGYTSPWGYSDLCLAIKKEITTTLQHA